MKPYVENHIDFQFDEHKTRDHGRSTQIKKIHGYKNVLWTKMELLVEDNKERYCIVCSQLCDMTIIKGKAYETTKLL